MRGGVHGSDEGVGVVDCSLLIFSIRVVLEVSDMSRIRTLLP